MSDIIQIFLISFFIEEYQLSVLFTKIMPIFRSLNLDRMLNVDLPNFFKEKLLFTTQLSSILIRKLVKKSLMVSNG